MSAHPEILRTQQSLLTVLHAQQDRLELLKDSELHDLKSEAEEIRTREQGTTRIAADMTACICTELLQQRKSTNQRS